MALRGRGLPPKLKATSGAQLALIAQTSQNTIKEWRRLPTFPMDENGETEIFAFVEWVLKKDGRIVCDEESELRKQRLEAAELLDKESKAVLSLAKARAAVGELIDRERAKSMVAQLCAYIRSRLQALPHEMASELPETAPTDLAEFMKLCGRLREGLLARLENRVETILIGMSTWSPESISEMSTAKSEVSEADSNSTMTSGSSAESSPPAKSPGRSRGRPRKSPTSSAGPTTTTTTPT